MRALTRVLLLAIGAGLLALGSASPAAARTLEDCEAIKDWHAYNLCLSSFGPRRGQRAVSGQPRAEDPETRVYGRRHAARQAARQVVPGLNAQRIAGGRVRATFDVGAPRRSAGR